MITILLVDDDPFQASARKAALETQFPGVERVADAAEALCRIEEPGAAAPLDLVIVSGHHLPGISGPSFVAELRWRKPMLPVLVLGDDEAEPQDYRGSRIYFLPRPVTIERMVDAAAALVLHRRRKTA